VTKKYAEQPIGTSKNCPNHQIWCQIACSSQVLSTPLHLKYIYSLCKIKCVIYVQENASWHQD